MQAKGASPSLYRSDGLSPAGATLIPNETFIVFNAVPFQKKAKLVLECGTLMMLFLRLKWTVVSPFQGYVLTPTEAQGFRPMLLISSLQDSNRDASDMNTDAMITT
jgi:hypothetical protein